MNSKEHQKPMNEVMLAMDIVDTIRRNQSVVERELGAELQDEVLLNRLKDIYGSQGIEVSDAILREGIVALREDRFIYKPIPPSFKRFLAKVYIKRRKWNKFFLFFMVSLIIILMLSFLSEKISSLYSSGMP